MSEESNGAAASNATPAPEAPPPAPPAPATTPPAPAPAAPAAAPTPPAPVAPPAAASQSQQPEPHWIKDRLEQQKRSAERALLADLGVTDVDAAKAAIAAANAAAEANKTAEERAADLAAKLKAKEEEAKRYQDVTRHHADSLMATLSEERRAAVVAIAGDDPAKQLSTIGVLNPTWAQQEQAAQNAMQAAAEATAAANAAPPPPPAAADTAPPPDAPNGSTQSPPDHRAVWNTARSKNPFAAASYGAQHPDIYTSD